MTTTLTERQRAIKTMLDRGKGAREIADELGITRNAVYQQIQRLRRNGVLESDYTPSGQPPREVQPGAELLMQLIATVEGDEEASLVAAAALVAEVRRTRDELDVIVRRLSAIVPR